MIFGTISAIVALVPKTTNGPSDVAALRPDLTEVGPVQPKVVGVLHFERKEIYILRIYLYEIIYIPCFGC